jgi:hypothetical protein
MAKFCGFGAGHGVFMEVKWFQVRRNREFDRFLQIRIVFS